MKRIIDILPGLIVCVVIALIAKAIGVYFPTLGPATISIFLGLLIGNTIIKGDRFKKGVRFSESDLLSYSIVLLGGTLSFTAILELGFNGLAFILLQMIATIFACIYIGKKLNFSEDFRLLMASGNAVCGSSAVGATAPVIGASQKDKAITITIVNITGTVLMLLLPLITRLLFQNELVQSSALIGGVLQSVGQVVASGFMVNEEVKDLATIFKIVRIIFLVLVIISFGRMKKKTMAEEVAAEVKSRQLPVPWYVIGFFITCLLFSVNFISEDVSHTMKWVSNQFEIIALAGIGMSVKIQDLLQQGVRSGIYAALIGLVQIISAILLITILL